MLAHLCSIKLQLMLLKVNLFLRIIRRRPDGYHDLASLFHVRLKLHFVEFIQFNDCILLCIAQVIDLGDTMTFSTIPGQADALTCDMEGVPTDASNLVIKVCLCTSFLCTKHATAK